MKNLPNFLFIGPDKTGSTWLYEVFKKHPNCYVPEVKDIYFFDRYYNRGWEWYMSFFENVDNDALAIGELSHDYIFSRQAAERIYKHLPEVKLMTNIRHPVDRSFSHYLYLVRSGLTKGTFSDAISDHPEIIENSLYSKHLKKYIDVFDKSNIGIFVFDDLEMDARNFARDVFGFLNIPYVDGIAYEKRVLPATKPVSPLLSKMMKIGANQVRKLGMPSMVGRIKTSILQELLYRPYNKTEKPEVTRSTWEHLMDIYHSDIFALEDMFDLDLSDWMNYEKNK